jgi:hypothetical protein
MAFTGQFVYMAKVGNFIEIGVNSGHGNTILRGLNL